LFDQNLILVGSMLLFTGVILYWAEKTPKAEGQVTHKKALLIGIVQAIAILPGISRSGSTIAGALILGIDRERAARFSFLMVLPLIFGSMAKSLLDFEGVPEQLHLIPLFIGFLASLVTGIFACKWMIALVKRSQLIYFSFYCFIVGGISLIYGLL
jgi:undecaprenyl-diphosphatase